MKYFKFFEDEGYIFDEEVLTNFALSLKTKPFVILSGISGSGKSKIVKLFAKHVTEDLDDQFSFMSVKPSWKNEKDLFGFHNVITGAYEATSFLKLMIRAAQNPEKPYILLLDEMNLAKVEHYFADYLSCLESRSYIKEPRKISVLADPKKITPNFNITIPKLPKVSESIVLSAFDLREQGYKVHTTQYPIGTYRDNRISLWRRKFSRADDSNWKTTYRSELNQGENRIANRLFEGGNNNYRLRKPEELSGQDLKMYLDLERLYYSAVIFDQKEVVEIEQDSIILHNKDNALLSTEGNEKSFTNDPAHWYDKTQNEYFIPSKIKLPLNLYVVGTVNIDETTYMFSPKVLDRANLIEFNYVDISSFSGTGGASVSQPYHLQNDPVLLPLKLAALSVSQKLATSHPDVMKDLLEVFNLLEKYNLHFGYRVINEISLYITNAIENVATYPTLTIDALDIQLLQKVLPKFNGSIQKLWDPFVELLSYIRNSNGTPLQADQFGDLTKLLFNKDLVNVTDTEFTTVFKYPRTAKKLLKLLSNLDNNGFTSFIE